MFKLIKKYLWDDDTESLSKWNKIFIWFCLLSGMVCAITVIVLSAQGAETKDVVLYAALGLWFILWGERIPKLAYYKRLKRLLINKKR